MLRVRLSGKESKKTLVREECGLLILDMCPDGTPTPTARRITSGMKSGMRLRIRNQVTMVRSPKLGLGIGLRWRMRLVRSASLFF